jgi:hypothetical protein
VIVSSKWSFRYSCASHELHDMQYMYFLQAPTIRMSSAVLCSGCRRTRERSLAASQLTSEKWKSRRRLRSHLATVGAERKVYLAASAP